MGKGYAEGPAAEEAERRLEELAEGPPQTAAVERAAVYGSTPENSERHFLGGSETSIRTSCSRPARHTGSPSCDKRPSSPDDRPNPVAAGGRDSGVVL